MVIHLVSVIAYKLEIRDHFMLFFLAQTSFLFALNELVVLKLFFFFFEGSVTDFVENLMNGLSGLFPKKIHIHPKSYSISEGSGPSKAPCL